MSSAHAVVVSGAVVGINSSTRIAPQFYVENGAKNGIYWCRKLVLPHLNVQANRPRAYDNKKGESQINKVVCAALKTRSPQRKN